MHWAFRRDELCDPSLCPDAPDDGGRCNHCLLDRLDSAQDSEHGLLVRLAIDTMCVLKLSIRISLEEIPADEFHATLIIAEEQDTLNVRRSSDTNHQVERIRAHECGIAPRRDPFGQPPFIPGEIS